MPRKSKKGEREYPIIYDIQHYDPPVKESKIPPGYEGCSTIITFTYKEDEHGVSESYGFGGLDRGGAAIDNNQLFQVWCVMSKYLSENLENSAARGLCESVAKIILEASANARATLN